jgi:16S rRNA (guanine(527)-N(7))-methyltransferase RsmG
VAEVTDLRPALTRALEPLFDPDSGLLDRLESYIRLLDKWSRRTNLTGFRTPDDLILHGLVDSLVPLPLLPSPGPCLDVGSGAGFPGLILAAAQPDRAWTLLEPRRKRASFLHESCRVLGLDHVQVVQERLEQTDFTVPTITSRAVGGIAASVAEHLEPGGSWILAASADDAERIESDGGLEGFVIEQRLDSPAGGAWLQLKMG